MRVVVDQSEIQALAVSSNGAKWRAATPRLIYLCNSSVRHERLQRKRAAVFYADVAGYSRLTENDEEGTHRVLSTYLDAIAVAIERYRGKLGHFAGDAVLADFDTAEDALTCTVQIQRHLKAENESLSDDRKLQFRIGINLGDVIVDRNEIYGNGVNVAVRLQRLADPGGICISGTVYNAIGDKLPLSYEYLGEQSVKNLTKLLQAFQVRVESAIPRSKTSGFQTVANVGCDRDPRHLVPLALGAA